jgi:hypothetical protein
MAITFTREYSQVMVSTEGSLKDVVKSFYCRVTGVDADSGVSYTIGFSVELPSPESNTFIGFNSLTPETLDSWTDANADVDGYEYVISESISSIVNPKSVSKDLPWQTGVTE